ncbi:MAG: hypothetical protein Fur0037_20710 [Planctomycetota bacterium]
MIAAKTWREIRVMAWIYFAILLLMLVPAILVWPDLYADLQRASAMAKAIGSWGEFMRRAIDAMKNPDEDFAFLSYMALQMYFKGTNVAGIAASVLIGTGLVARERETTTLEYLLSRPVSRGRILWQKTWPCLLALVIPIFLANWAAIPIARSIGYGLPFSGVTWCSVHAAAFVALLFVLTVLASVHCRIQAHAAFLVGGVVILELAIYFIPVLRVASLFRVSDFDWYGPIMSGNRPPSEMFDLFSGPGLTAWISIAAASIYALAHYRFARIEP